MNNPHIVNELQSQLGQHVRQLRLKRDMTVMDVAGTTELAEKSVRNLENGQGSTTDTLIKVLLAIDAKRLLKALNPPEKEVAAAKRQMRRRAPRATRKSQRSLAVA